MEEFIKAHEGRRIKCLSGFDIQQQLEEMGSLDRLAG